MISLPKAINTLMRQNLSACSRRYRIARVASIVVMAIALGAPAKVLTISEFRTLEFADVAGSSQGTGTVTITTTGNKTTTGAAIDFGGRHRVAEFKVINGVANGSILITLPTSVTLSNGASLHSFVSDPPAGTATLSNRGKLTIKVGATMDLPLNPSGGDVTATFVVYVDAQ
jgi:hypothetical protein